MILPIEKACLFHKYGEKSVFYFIEFVEGKGFRCMSITENKSGEFIKPHYSYFHTLMWLEKTSDGRIKVKEIGVSGYIGINQLCRFIAKHKDELQLTQQMIKYLCGIMLLRLGANLKTETKDYNALKEITYMARSLLTIGWDTGRTIFEEIIIDVEKINKLEIKI